ncbi:cubilin-like [Physella acuta]|uniref:cubilin-like n=1 Tax=Physella acuta TaxID=109671 RepID=UPI0027DAFF46|nr:cubilin-like [Physella acuta]
MDMGTDDSCAAGYIEIFDGPSTSNRTFGKNCTSWQTLTVSTTNFMLVVFNSSGRGRFLANFKHLGTRIILNESKGFISSPGYPLGYLNDMSYNWTIQGDANTYIVLNFSTFEFESCSFDYVLIYDGSYDTSPLLFKVCDTSAPKLIISTSNSMYIVFKTDYSVTKSGFYASFSSVGPSTTLSASAGYIASPGFPQYFLRNKVYSWTIQGSYRTFVVLNITILNLSDSPTSCSDRIQIYDGQSTSSVSLGRYCYSSSPVYVVSSSNYMHVVFRTYNTITNKGFYSNYFTQDCTTYLSTTSGTVNIPGYPNGYRNYSNCSWKIVGDAGTSIFLTFTDTGGSLCEAVLISQYDDESHRAVFNVSLCSQTPPSTIFLSSNIVFIDLITSRLTSYMPNWGFIISYTIRDLPYAKQCSVVDQCRNNLTCVNSFCICTSDTFYNNFTVTCHPKIDFRENCTETQQCKSNLQCLNGTCSCYQDYYYNPIDVMCKPVLDHTFNCDTSVTAMCNSSKYLDCLPDVNGTQRCLCEYSFYFEDSICVSTVRCNVQRPQAKNKSTTGVELQWEAATLGPNRTYGVSWVSASDETDRGTQAANESGVTVTGLTPGTSYTITVYTFLQQQGFYTVRNVSSALDIVTYPAKPGLVNTTASKLDKPPYIIRFQPSIGRVDNYTLSLETELALPELIVNSTEVELSDLKVDNEYKYSITAVNSVGDKSEEVKGIFKTANTNGNLDSGLLIGVAMGSLVFLIIVVVVFIMIKRKADRTSAGAERNPSKCTEGPIALATTVRPDNEYTTPPDRVCYSETENEYNEIRPSSTSESDPQEAMYASLQTTDESQNVYANFAFSN